jgi:hypothetical protein
MSQNPALPAGSPPEEENKGGGKIVRYTLIAAGALAGVIALIFLIGLGLAIFTDAGRTAPRIQLLRDIVIIIMGLELILIVFALAALVLQIARLVNLLQNEVKPILSNAQETFNTTKGAAQFIGQNATEPLIKVSAFLAGTGVFLREMGGLRKAMSGGGRRRKALTKDD